MSRQSVMGDQLDLMDRLLQHIREDGRDRAIEAAKAAAASPAEAKRMVRRVEKAADLIGEATPSRDDLMFAYSGLCQTCLPHSRPKGNHMPWFRESGRFALSVHPGFVDTRPVGQRGGLLTEAELRTMYLGVPYGTRARLILAFIMSEGQKSQQVELGRPLLAFLRSLGVETTGGDRGTIKPIREQTLRLVTATWQMQWTDAGTKSTLLARQNIARAVQTDNDKDCWKGAIVLSDDFYTLLRKHSVPFHRQALAHVKGSCLAFDLYMLFAYRLHRLDNKVHIRWKDLRRQIGAERQDKKLAEDVREALPDVIAAYPQARVEITAHGLLLKPSDPPIQPNALVKVVTGFRA